MDNIIHRLDGLIHVETKHSSHQNERFGLREEFKGGQEIGAAKRVKQEPGRLFTLYLNFGDR